jgi:hypothetical protein
MIDCHLDCLNVLRLPALRRLGHVELRPTNQAFAQLRTNRREHTVFTLLTFLWSSCTVD